MGSCNFCHSVCRGACWIVCFHQCSFYFSQVEAYNLTYSEYMSRVGIFRCLNDFSKDFREVDCGLEVIPNFGRCICKGLAIHTI